MLANRDNLNTILLCASSQVTKTFVLSFTRGLARTPLRTGACCTSLNVVHDVRQVPFSSRCALTSADRVGLRRCKKIGVDVQVVGRVRSGTLVLVESLTMLRTVVTRASGHQKRTDNKLAV